MLLGLRWLRLESLGGRGGGVMGCRMYECLLKVSGVLCL